jgi:prophage regulatory protein
MSKEIHAASPRFVRQKQLLAEHLPFSPSTLWRKIREGSFPKPIKLGPSITAWRVSDIEKWLQGVTK